MILWHVLILGCLWQLRVLSPEQWRIILLVQLPLVPPPAFWATLWMMIVAALTDLFDGFAAREWEVTSRLGKHGDPFTDKVYVVCALTALTLLAALVQQHDHAILLAGLTVLQVVRDLFVTWLRSIASLHGADVSAIRAGKVRSSVNYVMLCVVYCHLAAPLSSSLSGFSRSFVYALESFSAVMTLWSIGQYLKAYWPSLKSELQETIRGH